MKIRSTILIILYILIISPVFAQAPAGLFSVKGIITDSVSGKPADFVTISLKDASKQPVKSTLTKTDGSFIIDKIAPGKYTITAISVGYTSQTREVDLTDKNKPVADLGVIPISSQNKQLNEVTVTGDKPVVKQEADRITYDLQADPESKVNNVLEMMRKVPLLSLDGEDNILLKGNANYKILINGKPSSMVERNPKDILRSMPASTIQRIEVITTPPSKYDAEGLAGIINIITNKKIDNGYNGSVNVNGRFPVGGPGVGGNFTFKQGKFGLSVNTGGNLYNSPETNSLNSRITTGNNPTSLVQNLANKSDSHSGYIGTELSYEIDTLNLISGQLNVNGSKSGRNGNQISLLTGQDGIIQGYNLANNNDGRGNGMDAALNYQLGFKANKSQLLTFSYRFYRFEDHQFGSLYVSDPIKYSQPDYRQNNDGNSAEHTFQVDYVQPVKKLTIEAGLKGILRTNKSNFQYQAFDANTGQFELDPDRTNQFNNNQDVFGAYNTYLYSLKNWDLKGGVRIEETRIDADFISSSSKIKRSYFNVIPSVSVNRKFKNNSSLNFGYTQRIQRPGIYQLNPFVDRSNPSFESTGNPDLRPMLADNFSVGYNSSKKVPLNIMISYMQFRDLIMPAITYDPVTNITHSSYQNTGRARLLGANFNVNYNFTKVWNFSLNANVAHGWVEGMVNGVRIENHGFMEYASVSTGYKFDKGWRLNANLFMNGPNLNLQGTSNWYINSSISVNKDLIKDKLSFSASSNNPFAKYRNYRSESFGPDFNQVSTYQNFYRSYNLSLNYRFGKLKDGLKKNQRGINNDDVSNSKQ